MDDELDPQTDDSEEQTPDVVSQVQEIFPEEQPDLVAAHVENYQRLNPDASENEVVGAAQGLKQVKDEVAPDASPSAPVEAPSMSEFKAAAAPESAMPTRQPVDRKMIMDLQEKARQAADIHPALRILSFMPRFSGAAANLIAEKQAQGRGYQQQIKNMMSLAKEQREEEYRSHEDKRRDAAENRAATTWNDKRAQLTGSTTSPKAQLYQHLLGELNPEQQKILSQMTDVDLEKSSSFVKGLYEAQARRDEAKARIAEQRAYHGQMAGNRADAQGEKSDKVKASLAKAMGEDLDAQKSRGGALTVEAKKVNLAKHLEALATNADGSVKDLSNIPMEELSIGVANMLSGGNQAAAATIHNLTPHSLWGDIQGTVQYLGNHPEKLNQKEFVKMFVDTARRQGTISSDIIKGQVISRLPKHAVYQKMDPEGYAAILDANDIVPERDIDEHGRFKRTTEAPTTGTMIPVILPNGKPGMIPPDKLKSLESAGGKRR